VKEYYISPLPIVHNGIREVVTRLSVAQACLNHSVSEDHKKVVVQKEHVKKVVGFYRKVLKKLQLREYKRDREEKLKITESEFTKITKELGKLDYKILESLKTGGKSSTILAGEMGMSKRTIKEHYSTLRRFELINTVRGEGVELSAKGVKFLRRLSEGKTSNDQKSSEKVKEIFTRESEENDHYFTRGQSDTIEESDHPTVTQGVEKLRRYLSSRGEK